MRFRPLPLALAAALVVPLGMVPASAAVTVPTAGGDPAAGGRTVTRTVTGEVQRIAVEMRDGTGHVITVVAPERGSVVRVEDEKLQEIPVGTVATVDLGTVTEASQSVTEPEAGAPVLDVAVTPLEGSGLAAAPREDVPDFDGTPRPVYLMSTRLLGQAADTITTTQLKADVVEYADPYFDDSTNGAVRLRVSGGENGSVYRSWGSLASCDLDQALEFLDTAAAKGGAQVGRGKHTLVYTPTNFSCDFGGIAHVGDGGAAWVNGPWGLNPSKAYRRGVATHELGHNLTLGHSTSREECSLSSHDADGFDWECDTAEYGDPFDVMGNLGRGPLSGAQLDTMGLLTPESSVEVTSSRSVTLEPVSGLEGLRFATFEEGDTTYYIEYRNGLGRDGGVDAPEGGVLIRRLEWDPALLRAGSADPAYDGSPYYALGEGLTFQTATYGARITTTAVSPTEATVQIDMPGETPIAFTGVSDSVEIEPWYQTATWHVATGPTTTLTWAVDPSLTVSSLQLWRNGRRMLTLPTGQTSATVTLVDGWNELQLKAVVDGGHAVRSVTASVGRDVEAPYLDFLDVRLRTGVMTSAGAPAVLEWFTFDDIALDDVTLLNPARTMTADQWETWVDQPLGAKVWTLRATDVAGNSTTKAINRSASAVAETSATRTGGWSTVTSSVLLGGKAMRATTDGATMSTTFRGRSVAWVGSKGPDQGTATVLIDGVKAATIDLEASTNAHQRVLFVKNFWSVGTHTITVKVSPKALSDGFVVLK